MKTMFIREVIIWILIAVGEILNGKLLSVSEVVAFSISYMVK